MTDWTVQENVTTDWFGNVIDPPSTGLLLEESPPQSLLLENGEQLLLEN